MAPSDPAASAEAAGLRYVSDEEPGLSRRRRGRGFSYHDPDGRLVTDPEVKERCRALAIPPAYDDVWICLWADGHLQATGRDERGRKQYLYHPAWRASRERDKFEHMVAFGEALPTIRRRVAQDMATPGLGRERVLATVVRLLETTLIRIGNDSYARDNESYGLTTIRKKHVDADDATVVFDFRGKSGQPWHVEVADERIAEVVRACTDTPGYELFKYLDDDGERRDVTADDVNAYLREIAGEGVTAKDFRTWAGTVLAAMALQEFERFDSEAQAKKNVVEAVKRVAGQLGNTPAVCRQSYVHPHVLDGYLDGTLIDTLEQRIDQTLRRSLRGLRPEEVAVWTFLKARLERERAEGLAQAG